MEDCVATAHKALERASLFAHKRAALGAISRTREGDAISMLRDKPEHMQSEIGNGHSGSGPVCITLNASRESLCLLKMKVPVAYVSKLLDGLFDVVAAMFPGLTRHLLRKEAGPLGTRWS